MRSQNSGAATRGVLHKKVFLEISQDSQENTYVRVSFLIKLHASGLQLYHKGDSCQVFYCDICEISKNTFSYKTPLVAASQNGCLLPERLGRPLGRQKLLH